MPNTNPQAVAPAASHVVKSFAVVQTLSHVQLFVTLWTAAHQASLFSTIFQSLLKFTSIESWCHPSISSSVAPFSSCPQSFPALGFFSSELALCITWPKRIGASALALPMNIQGWFPLGLTGLVSWLSKGLSRVFSIPQFKSINSSAFSLLS